MEEYSQSESTVDCGIAKMVSVVTSLALSFMFYIKTINHFYCCCFSWESLFATHLWHLVKRDTLM